MYVQLVGTAGLAIEEEGIRNGLEMVKSASDKHIDIIRPSARYYSASRGSNPIQTLTCLIIVRLMDIPCLYCVLHL